MTLFRTYSIGLTKCALWRNN